VARKNRQEGNYDISDAILCCLDNNDRTSCYVVILLNEIPVEQREMKPSHSYRDAHEFSVFEFELKQSRLTDPVSRKSIPFPMRVLDKSCTHAYRHTGTRAYRREAVFGKWLNDPGTRRFSGRVSGVMQSVPMPITKPGAARRGGGRRDVRRRDVIL